MGENSSFIRTARSVLGAAILVSGLIPAPGAPLFAAADSVEESLKAGSDALGRDALEEADQQFTQATNHTGATRVQRATAFAGRCAVRYKKSLSTGNPALIPQAINDCDRAIELKADLQQAYRIRGVALLSAGQAERAAEDLNLAISLHPDDYLAFQNRALALVKLGRAKEAMAELDAAIRLKPDHPWSYYNRGRLRIAQGEYETAIDDFIAFVRFKRDHEEVYRLRGLSRLLIGLPQQAVGDLYESLRLRPGSNPDALQLRGVAFYLLDRMGEAEQDLTLSLQQQPENVETRLWLYLARERLGKPGRELLTDPAIRKEAREAGAWPEALIGVFLGETPPEKGLEAARKSEEPAAQRLRENLSLLLIGEHALIRNRRDEAGRWLGAIKSGQGREAPHYRTAQQRLRHQVAGSPVAPPPYAPPVVVAATPAQPETEKPARESKAAREREPMPIRVQATPRDRESAPTKESAPAKEAPAAKEPPAPAKKEAPAAKEPPAPAKTSARGGEATQETKGKFAFKVASFSNVGFANDAMGQYAKLGLPVFLEQGKIQDKTYQRIWIGPFDDRSQAETVRERLRGLPNQNPGEITQR